MSQLLFARPIVARVLGAVLAALSVGAAADPIGTPVPAYDVGPSCRPAAGRSAPDYLPVCLQTEQKAREELQENWSRFNAVDGAKCLPLSRLGGKPTCTELLTCLELVRDARRLHEKSATGSATGRAIDAQRHPRGG